MDGQRHSARARHTCARAVTATPGATWHSCTTRPERTLTMHTPPASVPTAILFKYVSGWMAAVGAALPGRATSACSTGEHEAASESTAMRHARTTPSA